MSSIKPDEGGGEIDGAQEGLGAFVVAGCDSSERLEFGEEILDQMPCFMPFLVVGTRLFPIFLRRHDALDARPLLANRKAGNRH